ncbi:MAG: hypothetical protein JSS34_02045 [Proteobacteria bacterium]|nr:hypothetical protein [Pseudomonadota bacterium]
MFTLIKNDKGAGQAARKLTLAGTTLSRENIEITKILLQIQKDIPDDILLFFESLLDFIKDNVLQNDKDAIYAASALVEAANGDEPMMRNMLTMHNMKIANALIHMGEGLPVNASTLQSVNAFISGKGINIEEQDMMHARTSLSHFEEDIRTLILKSV